MLHATLDLLDRQLRDRDGVLCGNVDDLELRRDDDGAVYVTHLVAGGGALAYRLKRRKLGRWLQFDVSVRCTGPTPSATER